MGLQEKLRMVLVKLDEKQEQSLELAGAERHDESSAFLRGRAMGYEFAALWLREILEH
jgi:hypothetical protein